MSNEKLYTQSYGASEAPSSSRPYIARDEEHPLLRILRTAPVSTKPLTVKQREDLSRVAASPDWVSSDEILARVAASR